MLRPDVQMHLAFQEAVLLTGSAMSTLLKQCYACFLTTSWHCWWLLNYDYFLSDNHEWLPAFSTTCMSFLLFSTAKHDLRFILIAGFRYSSSIPFFWDNLNLNFVINRCVAHSSHCSTISRLEVTRSALFINFSVSSSQLRPTDPSHQAQTHCGIQRAVLTGNI